MYCKSYCLSARASQNAFSFHCFDRPTKRPQFLLLALLRTAEVPAMAPRVGTAAEARLLVQAREAARQQKREAREAAAKARKLQAAVEAKAADAELQATLKADAEKARQRELARATMPAGRPGWKGAVAYHSVIGNVGDAVGTARMPSRFTIEAGDMEGNRLTKGGDSFQVSIRGPARTHARVSDLENGRYSVDFTPSTSGDYEISVAMFGIHLPGSPFAFRVYDPYPYAKNCILQGDALTSARAREPQTFDVGFRDQLNQLAPAVDLEVFVEPLADAITSQEAAMGSPSPSRSHSPEPSSPSPPRSWRSMSNPTPDKPPTSRGVRPTTAPGAQLLAHDPLGFSPPAARRKSALADRSSSGSMKRSAIKAVGQTESPLAPTTVIASNVVAAISALKQYPAVSRHPSIGHNEAVAKTSSDAPSPNPLHKPNWHATQAADGDAGPSTIPHSRQVSSRMPSTVFATAIVPAVSRTHARPTTVMATAARTPTGRLASPRGISMQMHQQHMELWSRRETTDKLHSKGIFKVDRHDPKAYLAEFEVDPTGFAFGGVFPGTVHAHGRLVDLHQVSYSIGRAGVYHLHVKMRREGTPLPGSPFKLTVLPGSIASAGTSFLVVSGGDMKPARVVRGRSGTKFLNSEQPSGCRFTLQSCDEVGNCCINGGADVACMCPLAPQLSYTCKDEGNGLYSIFFNAPPRIEACTYKIDVKIADKPVLNSPIKMILEGSPNEEGASMSDHLWLGISLEGARLLLNEIGDQQVQDGTASGYELCVLLRAWLSRMGQDQRSVCEVLSQSPRWRHHIGRANVFYSHRHSRPIGRTLGCMERAEAKYRAHFHAEPEPVTNEPEEDEGEEAKEDQTDGSSSFKESSSSSFKQPTDSHPHKLFFWLDYFAVRQCQNSFDLHMVSMLIKKIGHTMVELDTEPDDYLASSWCLFELHASILANTRIHFSIDCLRAMQLQGKLSYVPDEKSVRIGAAKRIVDFAASTCSNAQERKEIEASLLPGKEQFKVAELGERLKDLNELILAKVRDGIALVVQKETLNAISLDLADRKIGSKQAPFLASLLPTTPLLEVLDLSALDLDDEDLAKVIRSIGMSSIRKLIISASRIGADQSSILADVLVGPSKQLTSLIADSTGLADKGAAAFAKKLQTAETSMTSLNLSSNMIQAEGMCELAKALQENLTITELLLDDNLIGDSYNTTRWLPVVMPGGSVSLKFQHENSPSLDGMAALGKALMYNRTLTKLSIVGNRISDEAYASLARAMLASPHCQLAYLRCDKFCIEEDTISIELMKGSVMAWGPTALLAALLAKNSTVTSLSTAGASIGDSGHRTLGEALQQSAVSKLTYLTCDKWSMAGGPTPTTVLNLESRQLSAADMLLIGSMLTRNRSVTHLVMDGFRLPPRQFMGEESIDRRAPLACHIIVGFARGMSMEMLRDPAYASFDENGEGYVHRTSFVAEMLASSSSDFQRIEAMWNALDKDDAGCLSLQSFARGVRLHTELTLSALSLHLQRDPLMDFLVFRWKHAKVPSAMLDVAANATGKLKVQGILVGTLVPTPFAPRKNERLSPLADRVRFMQPTTWLRAVDFLKTPEFTKFKGGVASVEQQEYRLSDSFFACNGQPNATFEVQCTLSTGSEFSFTVQVLEWTFDLNGARLRTLRPSPNHRELNGMTVVKHIQSTGVITCAVDNTDEARTLTLRCPMGELSLCAAWLRPRAQQEPRYVNIQLATSSGGKEVRLAELDGCRHKYLPGQRLLVLHQGGRLLETRVVAGPGRLRPTRHILLVPSTGDIGTFDLHAFNHCRQRFESRLDFHESRQEFRDAHLRGKAADGATAAAWEMAAWSARGLEEQLSLLAAETRGSYPESEVEILLHERWAHEEEDW